MPTPKQHKTIAEILREFLESEGTISGPGGRFTGLDYLRIEKVLSGKADNFTVFNNAGGCRFHIWFFDDIKVNDSTLENFEAWIKKDIGYHYMYKINGKETIVQILK